ncbi:MAG: ABC transporter permease subunit [Ruminococcus sp.]|nr:ABC transporter permease subunit [Ruminococcus sp.]
MKENRAAQTISSILLPVLFGVLIIVLWQGQILHKFFNTDTNTLPLPSRICHIILDNIPAFSQNALYTIIVAVAGLLIGSIIGYLIAVFAATFQKWGKGGLTIVGAFNAIPIVALAPVMTNWTKDISSDPNIRSMFAKTFVVMIVCIASMSINAYRGLTELKPFALDLMSSYAAKKSTVFFKLRLPNSVPYIFTALRVSVPISIISAVVSEYFAEYIVGVGREIRENIVLGQYPTAWAYIVVACLIGLLMYGVLMLVESIVLKKRRIK